MKRMTGTRIVCAVAALVGVCGFLLAFGAVGAAESSGSISSMIIPAVVGLGLMAIAVAIGNSTHGRR